MLSVIIASTMLQAPKHDYRFSAEFMEGCGCKDVCVTEITGRDAGCHGVGAIHFTKGTYAGKDISGTIAAFAWASGKWVRLVIQAPVAKRDQVTRLMKAFLDGWGEMETVEYRTIDFETRKFAILAQNTSAPGPTVMGLTLKPVFGGDGRSAVVHSNLTSPMHSSLMQAEAISGSCNGKHSFTLKGTNAFYNPKVEMKGRV